MKLFKRNTGASQDAVTTTEAAHAAVTTPMPLDSQSTQRRTSLFQSKRVRIFGVIVVMVVVGVVLAIIWQQNNRQDSRVNQDPSYVMTDEAYAKVRVSSLKKTPPAENASVTDRVSYYDELLTNEFMANDFAAVTKTYETASAKFGESNLTFNMYVAAAQAYAKAGDKAKAHVVLGVAEQFVTATVPDTTQAGDFRRSLAYYRAEISR